ncbi:hypothetical protein KVR01_009284 [Diaporthe batatas]|uniref:uncharacterized protein n=1 Tax=Diaporthe batatas TaxID=748121 RepID=UPI001D0382EA|nr:uncharacterized protein KVR01_009284 [Diaporthe batatas]KAG8161020.1 hypothetical protein KVR01_009284 [Diaporthe batatas]
MDQSASRPFDLRVVTASDLQGLLQDGKTTSVELVELHLKQIETYNGYLHAVISTAPKASLLKAAEKLDQERKEGKVRSPIHGIPVLVKDNIATSPSLGMDTTAGSFALKGSRPRKSADLIEKLTEAGAIILGKANLSELSYFKAEDQICGWSAVGGQSQSAYVRGGLQEDDTPGGHSNPGGSSSGPAIAVSAGLAPVSIGTETAASLISPASKAGLYTIKPTIGLISQQGIVPISSLADSAGPMTKSVLDQANLLDILVDPTKTSIPQGGYKTALTGSWADLKIGVLDPADWGTSDSWTKPDPGATKQMNEAFENAYATIESQAKAFHKFVPLPLPSVLKIDGELAHRKLFTGYFKRDFEAYLADLDFSPVKSLEELVQYNREHADQELPPRYPSQDRLEGALADKSTPEELDAALKHARQVTRNEGIDKIMKEYDIDAIIGPAESAMPTIACASGYPIAAMPLGYLKFNGRPFGMAAIAAGHQEATLVKVQSAWEATFPSRQPPPYEVFGGKGPSAWSSVAQWLFRKAVRICRKRHGLATCFAKDNGSLLRSLTWSTKKAPVTSLCLTESPTVCHRVVYGGGQRVRCRALQQYYGNMLMHKLPGLADLGKNLLNRRTPPPTHVSPIRHLPIFSLALMSARENIFSKQWEGSVSSCRENLEPDDLRQVSFYGTWNDVERQICTHQEFAMLAPGLLHLKAFLEFLADKFEPNLDTSVVWGMIVLINKLAREEEGNIPRIPRMLRDLCHRLEVLNNYGSRQLSGLASQMKEAALEIAVSLLSFFSHIVKFMRSDFNFAYSVSGPGPNDELAWRPLEKQYSSILNEIDDAVSRIKDLSELTTRTERHKSESGSVFNMQPAIQSLPTQTVSLPLPIDETAKLPCIIHPPRLNRFFDRTDVVLQITEYFSKVDWESSFRSFALYGLGGVGKSSIALRYAETLVQRGELDALFWVHSEKPVTISQSFTDIALRLRLPDARIKDHDENRAIVLSWLQQTKCRWLIVYDNAESIDLLLDYWPAASRGQALITTRNRSFAFHPADSGLEISSWDAETGSRFLAHLLSTDVGTQLTTQESKSAHDLSEKLSGHALAISTMAGLIHRRAWSISEFLSLYNKQPEKMHGISGNSSINALWDMSFQSLDEKSSAILGVLCFLSPDNIPQSLFEIQSAEVLPSELSFCADQFAFWETIENLLTLALIKRDKETRTLSVHRLVQMSFNFFLTPEQRQTCFNNATILVANAFPRRDTASAQLYLMWERCAAILQHVLSLKDCFRKELAGNPAFKALQGYYYQSTMLSLTGSRYLLEINAYSELEDLIQVNTTALGTLSEVDRTINLQGSLTSHRGQLLVRLGSPHEGVNWLRKSYKVRSQLKPLNLRESAWAAENAANGIATINEFPEAVQWHEKARDHWLEWSEKNGQQGTWPAVLKKSMGTTLIWAGQLENARNVLNQAMEQIETTEPYNWAMAAYTHFALGTLDRRDRLYDSAEAHFMEAQNLWTKGDQLRTDPFNAACMYKMGCVALDQFKVEAAVKHLRDAKVVTDMRKGNMVAEHARCIFKLSEALQQEPRGEVEAAMLHEEAERLLRARNPMATGPASEATYDDLVNILWR